MVLPISDERISQPGRTHAGSDDPDQTGAERESPRADQRLLLALGLFLLAPVVAEYLLGNLPITAIYSLLVLAPLYGGGALLIREMARRARLSWASIVVLALAYGVLEEGITSMSLFNPNYAGERLLDFGYIASLGIAGPWTVYVLTLHTVWSVSVPILIMEVLAGDQRQSPWLGRIGLAVTALLFVFGIVASTFISIVTYQFVASTPQLLAVVITVLSLIGAAAALGGKIPTLALARGWRVPHALIVGVLSLVATSLFRLLPRQGNAVLYVVAVLLLEVVVGLLVFVWATLPAWTDAHRLALGAGALATYAWLAFRQTPMQATGVQDAAGNVVLAAGAVLLIAVAAMQIRQRHATSIAGALVLAVTLSAATLSPSRVVAQTCTSEHETGIVPANGISIAYASDGSCDGQAVVLIGGTGEQLIEWPTELVQELTARGYRVVRFDNRDVGLSTHMTDAGYPDSAAITAALQQGAPPPIPYTLRDMAGDAVGLLDALGIAQAHLVGASMGGDIAQVVAIDHPERVSSLTLLGADSGNSALPVIANPDAFAAVPTPPPDGDKVGFIEYEFATYKVLRSPAYASSDEELHARVERNVDRAYDPAGLVRQQTVTLVDHLDPDNYRHANLVHITAPTAIVQGAADPLEPLASAQDLEANIPGAELFVIPGLGHDVPPQLAPLFAAAIPLAGAPG
jgi:pimeloyl-ACP methyl ester carboxylesterase